MKRLVLTLAISLAFALGGVAQSLHYDFEDGTLQGWTTLDADGDGHCWEPSIGGMGYNSNGMVMSYSRDYATGDSLAPNEYLISPRLVLKEDWTEIDFWVCALDEFYCAEHFGVSISTTVNDDPLAFTILQEWTLTAKDARNRQGNWYIRAIDLSAYAGQEVYIAIHHFFWEGFETSQSAICVDDIRIDGTIHDCDAPEDFRGQYQQTPNGNQYAVLSWENPMHDFWFHYDQEPMSGTTDVAQWGIKIPAETFDEAPCELRKVMLYKINCQNQEGSYYVKIYFGEDSPGTMVEIEHHTLESGPDEWVELELTTPVVCTSSNSVWIVIETDGLSNVAAYCPTAGDSNGRWAWSVENGWHDYYAETGQGGDWMIRAFLEFYAKDDNLVDHFNIYRGESLNTMEHLTEVSKYANTYWDDLTDTHGNYYYRLTASYENGCESAYALDVEHPENDYVNIYVPGGMFVGGPEWYYEIQNENGSITYQHLYQAGDTIVNDEPTHILVKINTLYDKGIHTEETHEYVYERDGKLYWWNKTLEEFTVLYDFSAEEGDEWEIKVGSQSLTVHVDVAQYVTYKSQTYRMLTISDPDDLFSGDIVCGIGHLTSFFPERLMNNGDGVRVEGLRCYWIEDELVFKSGDEDCDAIYEELHGIEDGPSTDSRLTVYPNPTDGVLVIETQGIASLQGQTYRISNLTGQSIMTGQISAETQQIDVSSLPQGMYFITVAGESRKFVVR